MHVADKIKLRMVSASARPRPVGRALLILALTALALLLLRWEVTLTQLGSYLVCSDPPQRADLILVMGGDFLGPRMVKAAQLASEGFAPLVLVSGPPYRDRPEGEFGVDFLVRQGYPRGWFAIFGHHQASTLGEVLALRSELRRRAVRSVIVVTSEYHSRRCALLFRLFCPELRLISSPGPDPHYHVQAWWRDESSRKLFFSEWTKILGSVLVAYPAYRVNETFLELRSLLG